MFKRTFNSLRQAYTDAYDACQSKTNWGPLVGIIAAVVIQLLIVATYFDWPAHIQGILIAYWTLSIALACAVLTEKRCALKRAYGISKEKGELEIANMKFGSEIAAGFALIALAAPLIQLSSTLEQAAPYDRLSRLQQISDQIDIASGCRQSPDMVKCTVIKDQVNALRGSIELKSEKIVMLQADGLTFLLQHSLLTGANEQNRQELIAAGEKLRTLKRDNDWLPHFAPLLPIVSMLCAAIAVSSKIAVAWHDKDAKSKAHQGTTVTNK